MVSSYKVANPSSGYRALATASCFAKLASSHASLALSGRCRSRSARAVRPASLAASARYSVCRQSPVKIGAAQPGLGMPREQDRWLRPCRFARSGSVSRHFTLPPVSQRLKPQFVAMHLQSCLISLKHSLFPRVHVAYALSWRHAPEVSPSKREPRLFLQPPNPSFKRTRLRRSA
jgi:hypothetical protein